MRNISKSKYIYGIGCPVWFWKEMNDPEFDPKHDAATQRRFDDGHVAGELAKGLFPGGVDLPTENFGENIRKAEELVVERKVLFEAGFSAKGLYCRSDVLVPQADGNWELIEVKATTHSKDVHHYDLAFQQYVLEACGLKISSTSVVHLNNQYVRRGPLEIDKLFAKTDVTAGVLLDLPNVEPNLARLREIQAMPECPELHAFGQCNAFYDCPVHTEIKMPDGHVNELSRGGKKINALVNAGVEMLVDIPDDYNLTEKQLIQVRAARENRVHVEPEKIREFVGKLQYPIWHFDFETLAFGVPEFDESRPYQAIPFQYSLHEERADGTIIHHEFLAVGEGDPRRALLETMKKQLGDAGSVMVFYQGFERARLEELVRDFPEYSDWIGSILGRVVDLYDVFGKYWYYNPRQHGSASLKRVLPAITDISYDGMQISEGTAASVAFAGLRKAGETVDEYDAEMAQLREALLAYCKQDTFAMVEILRKLRELV